LHSKQLFLALAITGAAALSLAGCTTAAPPSDANSDAPYTVMVIESMTGTTGVDQSAPLGASAAAQAINDAGGLNGHDIEVISCDTASDPNKSVQCARSAIDKGVLAVVGSFDPIGSATLLPVLEAAKIPYIGPLGIGPADFTSPVSFPVSSGAPGGTFGMVALMKSEGCTTVALWGDSAFDPITAKNLIGSVESAGMTAIPVELPQTATDVTPQVSQALDGNPDCVAFSASGLQAVQLFKGVRGAGSDAKMFSAYGTLIPPFVQALGADAEGILVTADEPPVDDPALADFLAQLTTYEPSVEQPTQFTLNAWYAVQAFKLAVEGMDGDVNPQALLEHLGTMEDISLPGLETFSFVDGQPGTLYPRMFNATVRTLVVENGQYVSKNDSWLDVSGALPKG
jgi:ABC-type branched-subunit amino acid transport system substrate-binding protein